MSDEIKVTNGRATSGLIYDEPTEVVPASIADELLLALKSLIPILDGVRYSAGLGASQMKRLNAAKEVYSRATSSGCEKGEK